ncbi:Sterol O-acyltransferase 2 [Vulpes lagopus]
MEPKATRLRRGEGPRGEQEDRPSGEGSTEKDRGLDLVQWTRHMEVVKTQLLEHARGQLTELLDRAMWEAVRSYPPQGGPLPSTPPDSLSKGREPSPGKRKIFIIRKSLLELMLEFDLLIFSFGQLPLALMTWVPMFLSTLLVPYQVLRLGERPRARGAWVLRAGLGCVLLVAHTVGLCALPVLVALKYQLPPASRCILVFEQVRLLMKSYSFLREAVPGTLCARVGEGMQAPSFSSYLYFLFCPTLIYRKTYPRTPNVRWNYVAKNFAQALGCVLYACFILSRLCVPVFANMSREPFSTRALVLSIMHATLPGIFMLLLIFFAFLHCWLNAFAEMLRFGDRMFYRDWWNSTSFSNYYRTWNVVVHDWLYSYVYQDGLWLLGGRARGAAMLAVFLVSAVVHEYIFCFVLGFFYPVMLILFLVIGGLMNFMMHDRHTGPAWNVLMWTMLFLGQGIQVSLYCQEWYARRHCPLPQTTFWGLVTPRSWSCHT